MSARPSALLFLQMEDEIVLHEFLCGLEGRHSPDFPRDSPLCSPPHVTPCEHVSFEGGELEEGGSEEDVENVEDCSPEEDVEIASEDDIDEGDLDGMDESDALNVPPVDALLSLSPCPSMCLFVFSLSKVFLQDRFSPMESCPGFSFQFSCLGRRCPGHRWRVS